MIGRVPAVATLLLAGLLVAACGTPRPTGGVGSPGVVDSPAASTGPTETNPLGVVPPDSMSLAINNGTTLTVSLVVNGSLVASLEPNTCLGCGVDDAVPASLLPPLPWHVEARSPSNRLLVALDVHEGEVDYETSSSKGDASRVDLSCGRLDLWSGPPLDGPKPGPGTPGDCLP